jgi:hypothetical protein
VTGDTYDAVTQLGTKVEEQLDAAVAEGQKDVQATANASTSYLEQAKSFASSAISTAVVCPDILFVELGRMLTSSSSRISLEA